MCCGLLYDFQQWRPGMRVLIANKFFFRNGGSEAVMLGERAYLQSVGVDVVDFSMADERNLPSPYAKYFVSNRLYRASIGRVGPMSGALTMIHSPEAVAKIAKLIRSTGPDLVHCHNIYHQLTPSIIGAAKRLGVPVILTLHDFKPVCPVYNRLRHGEPCSACLERGVGSVLRHRCADGSFSRSLLLYLEAIVQRALGSYERVDRFIAPSRFMRDAVAMRVPVERMAMLYNGVDVDAIQPSGEDAGYVLYLGRLSMEKGVETLLMAHEAGGGRWPLVIAGIGPATEQLKMRFGRARFLGHLSGEALADVICKASVITLPSKWYENCPMSILEAMAYGKPVVGSRMGGIPELVVENETGLLFVAGDVAELAARLETLMSNPDLRKRMGAAARSRAESMFSLVRHNEGLMSIYREVLGERLH
jgi:glycosyltransferase involved in cell wall biosynthesis